MLVSFSVLVDALPESPPKWKVGKCDDIDVEEAYFGNVMVSLLPVTSTKVCHSCANIDKWMTHASYNISQEEVSESHETKWSNCYVVQ